MISTNGQIIFINWNRCSRVSCNQFLL